MAAVTSPMATPSSSHRLRSNAAYSSALRSTRVSARQSVRSISPSNRANEMWVLPMSTASSMTAPSYPQTLLRAVGPLLLLVALAGPTGCKKRSIAENPKEHGKLTKIAALLEQAYGSKPLPALTEPDKLADRLDKWDDFRGCTVRTYVARKRELDRLA